MRNFNQLSRAEMKNVLGGVAQISCRASGSCTGLTWPSYDSGNSTDAGIAQAIADSICEAADCCTDVDCPGAA